MTADQGWKMIFVAGMERRMDIMTHTGMNRRTFLKLSSISAITAFAGGCFTSSIKGYSGKKPNIVFIFTDDHAFQAISAYGSKINKTPNIDSIARDGAIFNRNYCANSICTPSRASVLTGKHSHINGVTAWQTFDGSQFTFPQELQKSGYRTGLFGKWHLGSDPTGFDEWMVYPGQGHYYNPDYLTPAGKIRKEGYSVEITTDLSIDFMKKKEAEDRPFLLMCQYKAPHRTWMPGPKYLNMFKGETVPEPETLFDDYSNRASVVAKHAMGIDEHMQMEYDLKMPVESSFDVRRMTEEQRRDYIAAYKSENDELEKAGLKGKDLVRWKYQRYIKDYLRCIAAVDDNVGRILQYLKEKNLDRDTIVIYSSDQGFYLGEHGWFDKRWIFEESFRMPLVMRWPGVIRPGTVINEMTQNIDYAPTFMDAVGLEAPSDIQGMSFMPLIKGKKPKWRDVLYYHYHDHGGEHQVPRHCGVRTDRYKLAYYYTTEEWDLFDLEKDPREMKSVYSDPTYASVVVEMKKLLISTRDKYKDNTGPTKIDMT